MFAALVVSMPCQAGATPFSGEVRPAARDRSERGTRIHLGVERLFGVAAYDFRRSIDGDFGRFDTTDRGVAFQILGSSPSRGDGEDGVNLAAMPRGYFEVETPSRIVLGVGLGGTVTSGRRGLVAQGQEQDPYVYPVRVGIVAHPRFGKSWSLAPRLSWGVTVGPQLLYLRYSGDGARETLLLLQVSTALPLSWEPHENIQFRLSPTFDAGFFGRVKQTLQVNGVPNTSVEGSARQHSYGISLSGGWVF